VMVLKQSDGSFDAGRAIELFDRHGAIKVIEGDQFV